MEPYGRNGPAGHRSEVKIPKLRKKLAILKISLSVCMAFIIALSAAFIRESGAGNEIPDASGESEAASVKISDISRFILSCEMPVIYGVDLGKAEREKETAYEEDIYFDVLPEEIKLEILRFANEPKEFFVGSAGPQVLIYHTHTLEAYRQTYGEEYVEAGAFRTMNAAKSVVAVGEALKKELEKYGFTVLHDTTNHEPPSLSTAYSRSLATMKKYQSRYPSLKIFIDLHRDAGKDAADFVTVDGVQCARVMFVVGTSGKAEEKPKYESNYKLALALTNELESIKKGFTRPVRIKNARSAHYNQQVSDMCLLIEVGHNGNSLGQALNSAKYIARAISGVISIK